MEFSFEQVIPAPLGNVFAFHKTPSYLKVLMRDWPTFRLLHHEGSVLPGRSVWIEEMIAGCIPVVLGFRHTIYEPPCRFGEELIHGPFNRFVHVHEFEDQGGGTLVRDRLLISLPRYYGGALGMRWLVAPKIRQVFEYRQQALHRLAEQGLLNQTVGTSW